MITFKLEEWAARALRDELRSGQPGRMVRNLLAELDDALLELAKQSAREAGAA